MKKSEFMLHAAMFDQRLLNKTCTVIVVTLLYGCQISVLSAISLDFIKYNLKRSNADSLHHHLAYMPNRKLYPNIRCRCGLDTVFRDISTWNLVYFKFVFTLYRSSLTFVAFDFLHSSLLKFSFPNLSVSSFKIMAWNYSDAFVSTWYRSSSTFGSLISVFVPVVPL